MNHLIVDELLICDAGLKCVQVSVTGICRQPRLAIIGAFLIEYHINRIVARLATMCEVHDFLVLEILLEFLACARSQTFIIFDIPSGRRRVCRHRYTCCCSAFGRTFAPFFPRTIFAFIVEHFLLSPLLRLQNRCIHKPNKSRKFCKRRPLALKHIDTETLDMRTVQILIRHKEHLSISKTIFHVVRCVFAPDLQPENLLDFGDFIIIRDFLHRFTARVHHFAFHRIDANEVAVFATKTRNDSRLC